MFSWSQRTKQLQLHHWRVCHFKCFQARYVSSTLWLRDKLRLRAFEWYACHFALMYHLPTQKRCVFIQPMLRMHGPSDCCHSWYKCVWVEFGADWLLFAFLSLFLYTCPFKEKKNLNKIIFGFDVWRRDCSHDYICPWYVWWWLAVVFGKLINCKYNMFILVDYLNRVWIQLNDEYFNWLKR